MPSNRRVRFELGGEWDIEDLAEMGTGLRLAYTYFYWLTIPTASLDEAVRIQIQKHFWSGSHRSGDRFTERLYHSIPVSDALRVVSITYNSPGWIDLGGATAALGALAWCVKWFGQAAKEWGTAMKEWGSAAKEWTAAGKSGIELYDRVQSYFEDRKKQERASTVALDEEQALSVDQARALCFEFGKAIGLIDAQITQVIELTGNPISGLRLLATVAREARRVSKLEEDGKLKLPDPKTIRDESAGKAHK